MGSKGEKIFNQDTWHPAKAFTYDGVTYSGALGMSPKVLEQVRRWVPDEGDVTIASYIKSGTTWCAAVVQYILLDGSEPAGVSARSKPYLEFRDDPTGPTTLDQIHNWPKPMLTKTHLHYQYLQHGVEQGKGKTIIVMRNPKDVMVSYFHHLKISPTGNNFNGTFADFVELMKSNRMHYGNIFDWYRSWWPARHQTNIKLVNYEDMIKDPERVVHDLATFLGKDLPDAVVDKIVTSTSFKQMAKKTTSEYCPEQGQKLFKGFFRKGEVGDWMNWFTKDQNDWVDSECEELSLMGLQFQYK